MIRTKWQIVKVDLLADEDRIEAAMLGVVLLAEDDAAL